MDTAKEGQLFSTEMDLTNENCFGGYGFGHQVPESEYFKASIRDFISTSIAPHISSIPLSQEMPSLQAITSSASMSAAQTMAAVALQQDTAILTDISSQAVLHGEDDASFGGNIAREEEHYFPWTMQTSHYVSVSNYPLANLGDYNYFDINPPSYGTGEPFQTTEWPPSSARTSASTSAQGSRKGKGALVEAEPGSTQSLTLPPTSQNLGSLQQEYYLEKLSKPPSSGPQESSQIVMPPSGVASASGSSAGLRSIGGHSPTSRFQPYRQYSQFPSFFAPKKQSFIYKWATVLAPQIMRMRGGLQGLGSGGSERLSLSDSLATHVFDPRSPTSLAHDHLAAETHKIAERKRRYKMNNKLRTLISIVPIIDKKDKVSVLTSTIEYIRQLNSRISSLEDREGGAGAAATTSRAEEEATVSVDREEELALFSNVDSAGAGPSSSSSSGGPVVLVEGSPDSETWLIKVQARNYSRSLIQLLNVFQELGLEVITVDYGTMNDRFRAKVCIKNSKNSSTVSSSDLKETLCRVLEIVESPTTGLR